MSTRRVQVCGRRPGSPELWALVDEADYDFVMQWRWTISRGYAIRHTTSPEGKPTHLRMHRALLELGWDDPRQVDHINRDRLDNRRENLRFATQAENCQNVPARIGSTSTYRGVSWDTDRCKWLATAAVNGRLHNLGRYASEEEAAGVAAKFRAAHLPFAVESTPV